MTHTDPEHLETPMGDKENLVGLLRLRGGRGAVLSGDEGMSDLPDTPVLPTESKLSSSEPIQSTDLSSRGSPVNTHPVSMGGKVVWNDHSDLLYTQGKDGRARPPLPVLSENYKSKGPLKNFDFSKLRGNNTRKEPVNQFRDKWSKEDKTPSDLVAKIIAYFDENEDRHMTHIFQRAMEIGEMNEKIASQEHEIRRKDDDIKDRNKKLGEKDNEIDALKLRVRDLEAEAKQEDKPSSSRKPTSPMPTVDVGKLISDAETLNARLIESRVRVMLLRIKTYMGAKQYPAASGLASDAEALLITELNSLSLLRGRVLYWRGRAAFELKLWKEAVDSLEAAIAKGLTPGSGEVECDDVEGWYERARAAHAGSGS